MGSHRRSNKNSSSSSSTLRKKRKSSYSDSEPDSDSHPKKKSSRRITEQEVLEYSMKKFKKNALKVAKKSKAYSVSGYSNESNPFGDASLNERFVWRKKIERDVTQGVPFDDYSAKAELKRQEERMADFEKIKKSREERAIKKAKHEEEMAMLARERARAEFQDWEKKEEEFQFDQSNARSEIRVRQGRIKPIDVLITQINVDDFDIGMNEPYMLFKGLSVGETEDLHEEIKMRVDSDRDTPTRIEFWEALLVVSDWELGEANRKDALDRAREERGLHSSIEADVMELLQGKSRNELEALQSQIESRMRSGTAKVVEFWEAVLKRVPVYKAKACLRAIHTTLLRMHVERLERPLENEDTLEAYRGVTPKEEDGEHDMDDVQAFSREPILNDETCDEAGSYSPELLHGDEHEEAMDSEEDRLILERKRMALLGAVEEGDAVFGPGAEVNLDTPVCWWHDKYRPRKPKYFNRVHTGYEWNKYNQTHYDHDNPPPKAVQGYKFDIFYPDLVDTALTPTYTIEKDRNNSETCILKFHAGPPYEDIAFRIVNKEWEYSRKKGFKCTFERGILHLYFSYQRHRYRR